MIFGNLEGLVNGTESVVFDHEVTGSAVSSIATGNILNGDEDGVYTIIIRHIGAGDASSFLQFNGDTGTNYGHLGIYAENTTAGNYAGTGQVGIYIGNPYADGRTIFSLIKIYAKSGSVRLVNTAIANNITGTTVSSVFQLGGCWNNTVDNLISARIISTGDAYKVGSRIIILKQNNFTNGTPTGEITTPYIKGSWVRVGTSTLTATASSVSFTGLSGDTDVVYRLLSQITAAGSTGTIKVTLNADTGNQYGRQSLTGVNTTVAAARSTPSCFLGGETTATAFGSSMDMILFAKSGFIRPCLCKMVDNISATTIGTIAIYGQSYDVTNTTIGTITIATTSNNFAIGSQFSLYALRPNG